jgi:SAM-dependent methyltransferase
MDTGQLGAGDEAIIDGVARYYSARVGQHGPTPQGVDWNSPEGQRLRFTQLLKAVDGEGAFSILDYGCGYGALIDMLDEHGAAYTYQGFDIADAMLTLARERYQRPDIRFTSDATALEPADYVVASGIFNVKQAVPVAAWQRYMLRTLDQMAELAGRAFAFNVLTGYSDSDRMRADLYYADPLALFEHCRRYSRRVALLHDYPLYEFTMIVRT